MTNEPAHRALERLLLAIERELVAAAADDVLAAAHELGIKPEVKGSAALVGITMFARPRTLSPLAKPSRADRQTARRPRRGPKGDSAAS